MIKNTIIFILVLLLAWMVQDYFTIKLPNNISNEITHTKNNISKIEKKENIKTLKIDNKPTKKITLAMLLAQNKFYDALSFYLNDSTLIHMQQIEAYLTSLSHKNPTLALKYMKVFLDNEPQSNLLKLMVKTHITQGNLSEAIELIMGEIETYVSEEEDKRLKNQLRDVATQNIDKLLERKEYAQLINFLEEMIAYDSNDGFYSFRLAKLYMSLDKVQEATVLLESLQYDEVYEQNVKTLMESIDKEQEESYEYAIPLKKYGEHFVVDVILDGTLFTLMLDTGATFIFIDEDKGSMLNVTRDNIVLQTAGNDVQAKLCNISNMKVGNLELSHIDVTLAPFKRDGIDGLLGMNFFKHFQFFINQDEAVLYLNNKKSSK